MAAILTGETVHTGMFPALRAVLGDIYFTAKSVYCLPGHDCRPCALNALPYPRLAFGVVNRGGHRGHWIENRMALSVVYALRHESGTTRQAPFQAGVRDDSRRPPEHYGIEIKTAMKLNATITDALHALRKDLPAAAEILALDLSDELQPWMHALDVKLLPKFQPDFPLVLAICGGGSAGKSTLFNSLIGRTVSPTGGRAGLNRRVLAALHEPHVGQKALFDTLGHVFGAALEPMADPEQLTTPGNPVYCIGSAGPPHVVLLDTPDIDTGARGAYANRELARQSLESADAFIYIFTNATYNNRDNTDFIARLFTGLGTRPCYLVYRVYPSFSDQEVRDHALTAAANIYGPDYGQYVLDIFRTDDDNRVAAGQQPMTLRSINHNGRNLTAALDDLDTARLRRELMRSMLADAVTQADAIHRTVQHARTWLARYIDALEAAQRSSVQQALSHFPLDRVLRHFAEIWMNTDPLHIKLMRRTGRVVEWPYKVVASTISIARGTRDVPPPKQGTDEPADLMAFDLLQAANGLYQITMDERIQSDHAHLDAHPVVRATQERLRRKDWKAALTHIQNQKESLLSWSGQLQKDLTDLAKTLRGRMGLFDQIRQTFAAVLNVIPTTAAITYILSTGDPAGAVGLKVKLTGLLGLHDLYALIAIPATAGMKNADQRQLEQLLAPVARTWLAHKLTLVQALFEEQITGDVFEAARSAEEQAADRLDRIARHLSALKEVSA